MFKKKKKEQEESLTSDEANDLLNEKLKKAEAEIEALKEKSKEQEQVSEPAVAPEKPKEEEDLYAITEVPTQTAPIIVNSKDTKEAYSELTALCKIMNDMEKLKKAVLD